MKHFIKHLKLFFMIGILWGIWSFFVATHDEKTNAVQRDTVINKTVMSDESAADLSDEKLQNYRDATNADTKEENWSLATKEANRIIETGDISAYQKEIDDMDVKKEILKGLIGQ